MYQVTSGFSLAYTIYAFLWCTVPNLRRQVEEMFEPKRTIRDDLIDAKDELLDYVRKNMSDWVALGSILGIWLVMMALAWFLARLAYRKILFRRICKVRGVKFEAMRAGSVLTKGKMLGCQVSLRELGLFTDSHNGYGFRYENMLVAPMHVVSGMNNVALYANGKKMAIDVSNFHASRMVSDLVYVPVSHNTWAYLGVKSARLATGSPAGFVSAAGEDKSSSGYLRQIEMVGLLEYGGSTVPGMSGSVYHINGLVYGMHLGAASSRNIGVSTIIVEEEVQAFFRTEHSSDMADEQIYQLSKKTTKKDWNRDTIREEVNKKSKISASEYEALEQAGASWADLAEYEVEGVKKIRYKAQGIDERVVELESPIRDAQDALEFLRGLESTLAEVHRAQERLNSVEKNLIALKSKQLLNKCDQCSGQFNVALEQHVKQVHTYLCDKCEVVCKSAATLAAHKMSAHPVKFPCDRCGTVCRSNEKLKRHRSDCKVRVAFDGDEAQIIIGESAMPSDNRKTVKMSKQPSFLEKSSQRRRSPDSVKILSLSDKKPRSPSVQETLNAILESQQTMLQVWKNSHQVSPGPSSATRLN